MTLEDTLLIIKAKKLRIAQLTESMDGRWYCALYRRQTDDTGKWATGYGSSAKEAIAAAMKIADKPKVKSIDRFKDLI